MQFQTALHYKGLVQSGMPRLHVYTKSKKKLLVLCVCPKKAKIYSLLKNYNIDYCFSDFESVINYIQKAGLTGRIRLPTLIFIDIPFNQVALEKLHLSITYNKLALKVNVFYNSKHLTTSQTKFLKHSELIDDCFNFNLEKLISAVMQRGYKKRNSYQIFLSNIIEEIKSRRKSRKTEFFFKKVFDSIVAITILIVLLPLFILIALAIRVESRGPIFYNSLRAGRGYKIFEFYKFRSMVIDADKKVDTLKHLNQYDCDTKGPVFFKVSNDPRITRVGKFLRNTSLDELPQLLNVIKGDMSLVGNRPLPLYEAETLTTDDYVERFIAPAGITGLWQTKKRGKPDMSTEERIQLDILYSRKASPKMDLKILLSTPYALFQKSNV